MELSRQQQKSKDTKDKIFRAAKEILQSHGYEELSIKNICERAGVSNGSFYHHFKTKDDLLSYYIEDQPSMDTERLSEPSTVADVKETIIQVYLNYAKYCEELGVDFVSNYYTPKNQALNPTIRTERPYPIVTVEKYLKRAMASGILSDTLDLQAITTDIRMLIIGNVFEWCLHHGETDFSGNIRRSFSRYLDSIF